MNQFGRRSAIMLAGCLVIGSTPAFAQATANIPPQERSAGLVTPQTLAAATVGESTANTLQTPGQILKTGINLDTTSISANSKQLADLLKLTPVLERIDSLRSRANSDNSTGEGLATRVALLEAEGQALRIITGTNLAVEYTVAEINAEQQVYQELLSTYQAQANKRVQYSNWASYWSNGALWAVAEALTIPSWKRPKYAIGSGINGIIAGIIPSAFSLYSMHAANGSKHPGEGDPNMLAKIFNEPINTEVDYPQPVWAFLNAVPANDRSGKSRKDQMIDRWIADSNIPTFTDRNSKAQLDVITAITNQKKVVTISTMQTRIVMLSQLSAELNKMKRMLYELELAVQGEKHV